MKDCRIIVVGGNAAGPAAAAKAKRVNPDAEVIMIEAGAFISTGTCELPYVLANVIEDYKRIVFFNEKSFYDSKGVKVYTNHFVQNINRRDRSISVINNNDNSNREFNFDKLILATGSSSKRIVQIPKTTKNQFSLKTVGDYLRISSYLLANKVRKVLVIGAGYIGIETAEAFSKLGCDVSLFDIENLPFAGAETEIRNLAAETLKRNKIEFLSSPAGIKFNYKGDIITSFNYEGWEKEVDLILTAVGFEPNISLALSAKLDLGTTSAIKVDTKLKTSDPNIFAAGDCIEVENFVTKKKEFIPVATIAQKTGHIAGANAAGANEYFKPVVKNIAVKIFDHTYAAAGITSFEAGKHRFNFDEVSAVMPNLVKVMPGSENTFGKIVYDRNNQMILGASFYGGHEVIGYADMISAFIHNQISGLKLYETDYNYTPPRSPFINIMSALGRKIKERQ